MASDDRQVDKPNDPRPKNPNYEVGYRRPPIAGRFKKGQSGNPRGRPKATRDIRSMLAESLYKNVKVREGDRVRARPKIAAAIDVALTQALKGDHRILMRLMEFARKMGSLEPPQAEITQIVRTIVDPPRAES